jgi:hypothetical protein
VGQNCPYQGGASGKDIVILRGQKVLWRRARLSPRAEANQPATAERSIGRAGRPTAAQKRPVDALNGKSGLIVPLKEKSRL